MATTDRPAPDGPPPQPWRARLHRVIWDSDTPAGRLFDQIVVAAILVSVAVVLADSVAGWHQRFVAQFTAVEWFFTALFTLEYLARVVSVQRPLKYVFSFFGIVDLLAVLPTYLALFLPELHALIDVRILRLLRIFRIFRLTAYVAEYQVMGDGPVGQPPQDPGVPGRGGDDRPGAGHADVRDRGARERLQGHPTSVYWAITTMTTVGFGDITPRPTSAARSPR
jgi:voltage-gated potassium channel